MADTGAKRLNRLRIDILRQPEAFAACFAARYAQYGEFRLHYRAAFPEAVPSSSRPAQQEPRRQVCWLGLVVPKKFCKPAVRRNLIKRTMRQALRDLRLPETGVLQAPVLMLRLTRKLPAEFHSARSSVLAKYVGDAVNALVTAWIERTLVLPESGAA